MFNRKNYVNRMIEECGCDAKNPYSAVNPLTNKDREVLLPKEEEDKVMANMFMDLFKPKTLTIRDHLENFLYITQQLILAKVKHFQNLQM